MSGNLEYGLRDFRGTQPFTALTREDDYIRVGVAAQHARFNYAGFAPRLNCAHTINRSNVAFFDYTATECQIALSREF